MGATSSLVRPALQLAWAVAREGDRAEVPGPMRPFVRLSRLPERALDTVRSVVDEDTAFRERVAAAADEATLGRVPWLWLARPDGWADEVTAAAAASEARSQDEDDRRADRVAQRRLVLAEATLQRTDAELVEARAAAAELSAEVLGLRQERRSGAEEARRLGEALAAATGAQADAEGRAEAAEQRRAVVEQLLALVEGRLATVEADNARLEARLEAEGRARRAAEGAQRADEERTAASRSALGQAVAESAAAARDLGGALGRASLILGAGPGTGTLPPAAIDRHHPPPADSPADAMDAAAEGSGDGGKGERGTPSGGGPRRRPAPLPAAVFDDSPDAAAWLVRLPGAVLLVDGYNVTLNAWSGRDLPDQRHRLVTALAELAMRTGVETEVVFDGADDHADPLRSRPGRRPVRVTFSPPAVDADELIIERVSQLPATRPVIVATNDRRVRHESQRAGANLLSTEQLVTLLRRSRDLGSAEDH